MMRRVLLLMTVLAIASFAHAQPAPRATIELIVLHATQTSGQGSIGPGIGNMPQLQQPPFSAWNTYRMLAKQSLTLTKGQPVNYSLPNGRVVQVTLQNVMPGPRYQLNAAINQPASTGYLNLLSVTAPPNQTFFVAGQQFQGGVIIIGFTMR